MNSAQVNWRSAEALTVRNISLSFGALKCLDNVSLHVPVGTRHALLGANGAGKTTFFNAINGDLLVDRGSISLFGRDITLMKIHERIRLGLRRTYQQALLFNQLSVGDNLYLAVKGVSGGRFRITQYNNRDTNWREAYELAEKCGLIHKINTTTESLSHGELRQLEIGMALAGAPRVILFDEPAAGLSPTERVHLLSLINSLPRDITIIIIEHDIDIAFSVAERVTVLHNGKVIAEGSPSEIAANETVQTIYLGDKHG